MNQGLQMFDLLQFCFRVFAVLTIIFTLGIHFNLINFSIKVLIILRKQVVGRSLINIGLNQARHQLY